MSDARRPSPWQPASEPDGRRFAAATTRNREPILEVLRRVLPPRGRVLEIASGTGEHAAFFAAALPQLQWQPSDADPGALASIAAWRAHAGEAAVPNLAPPVLLDVEAGPWPEPPIDAIVCANMIHIAPWSVCLALLRGAAAVLADTGVLVLYGPFMIDGVHTAPSNAEFDARLRASDPAWGVRDRSDVVAAAATCALVLRETVTMPANNLTLVFARGGPGPAAAGAPSALC